jgi:hypothetical protein
MSEYSTEPIEIGKPWEHTPREALVIRQPKGNVSRSYKKK